MEASTPNRPSPLELDLPPGLEPLYSNLVRIGHSPAEIVLDFGRMLPGQKTATVVARLLMSPVGAKLFYRALADNLARYEAAFGEIPIPGNTSLASDLFRNIQPPDAPKP